MPYDEAEMERIASEEFSYCANHESMVYCNRCGAFVDELMFLTHYEWHRQLEGEGVQ